MKTLLALSFIVASALVSTLVSNSAMAANIKMHDKGTTMGVQRIELVVAQGNDLWVRSAVLPKSGLPEGAYGEVYECYTSREKLAAYLGNMNIFNMGDAELSKYISSLGRTFDCAKRSAPAHLKYKELEVIWYSGVLLSDVL